MTPKSKYMMLECLAMQATGPDDLPCESAHFMVPDETARKELAALVDRFERRFDLRGTFKLSEFSRPFAVSDAPAVMESWVSEQRTDLNDPLPLTVPELALYIRKHGPAHTWDEARASAIYRNAPPALIQLVVNARLDPEATPISPQPEPQTA